ncbi:Dynein light intermediate chain [Strongyloides ratti]|uniref:Dynein light intermediate chain n=1 Tax=Strongyloides ratti TaxID=34506 RepID=A0A090LBM4_STRRB|nr:Dynein light intermediate chain [Strongyloides ratti]CEF65533.1 Dynein light intermediate chain [Strongyloides ratti]
MSPNAEIVTCEEEKTFLFQTKATVAPESVVIVLGNSRSGKSSLVKCLTRHDKVSGYGAALEYNFMTVQQDFKESSYSYRTMSAVTALSLPDSLNMPMYILDGDESYSELLQTAFIPQLSRTIIILCASWERPETMLSNLKKWYDIVNAALKVRYTEEEIAEAQKYQIKLWQEYEEPKEEGSDLEKNSGMDNHVVLPLGKNILSDNCGASVIVVLTKVDTQLEMSNEEMDKIQYHIRKFCMSIGASLFYTSTKDDKQIQAPNVTERDCVLIPAGWDDENKLDILKETITNPEELFHNTTDFTPKLKSKEPVLVQVEDEQVFLKKIHNIEPIQNNKRPINIVESESGMQSNSVLASFFNNLIKPKEPQPSITLGGVTTSATNSGTASPAPSLS